ncbi:uncharacterized protein CMU_007570 [Cryptosporidium muris RN66]|uniref:Uncharacterized protein n=1 Tax=Cryptosporidium muris (strain RN66) TaxID=441375 RepID=B6ADH6_CRYMR|nr:uncharacterized protein CMU_007570 [Cryptosporidium muris RN66]EEA06267.1 hypothetical protein, conserved [Cryptosporidium muris RN66]|eukprot:XP_002140616.1 hypothetical protein [Cryptosporidium muris RN66]
MLRAKLLDQNLTKGISQCKDNPLHIGKNPNFNIIRPKEEVICCNLGSSICNTYPTLYEKKGLICETRIECNFNHNCIHISGVGYGETVDKEYPKSVSNDTLLFSKTYYTEDRPIRSCISNFSVFGKCIVYLTDKYRVYAISDSETVQIYMPNGFEPERLAPTIDGIMIIGKYKKGIDKYNFLPITRHPRQPFCSIEVNISDGILETSGEYFLAKSSLDIRWISSTLPLLMAYSYFYKCHILILYKLTKFNTLGDIVFFGSEVWRENSECASENPCLADTVYIIEPWIGPNSFLVYIIPQLKEARFIEFNIEKMNGFTNLCNCLHENCNSCNSSLGILKDVHGAVALTSTSDLTQLMPFNSPIFNGLIYKRKAYPLFNAEKILPTPNFLLVLKGNNKLALYCGITFICYVDISNFNNGIFNIIHIGNAVADRFSVLFEIPNHNIANGTSEFKSNRYQLSTLPHDLLVRSTLSIIFEVAKACFSTEILRIILLCDSSLQWEKICFTILGEHVLSSINTSLSISPQESIESPSFSGLQKKLKLGSKITDSSTMNEGSGWKQMMSFWRNWIQKNSISPFHRSEFSSMIVKNTIPHMLVLPNNSELSENNLHADSSNVMLIYLMHGLLEEFSLCPVVGIFENTVHRLRNDLLLPMSISLSLPIYTEYYQLMGNGLSKRTCSQLNNTDRLYSPPVLVEKIYLILHGQRDFQHDEVVDFLLDIFPLQKFAINVYNLVLHKNSPLALVDYLVAENFTPRNFPLLHPLITFPIHQTITKMSKSPLPLNLSKKAYILLERYDLIVLEQKNMCYRDYSGIESDSYLEYDYEMKSLNLSTVVLPHGRNTVDDQKNMLENLQNYYDNKLDIRNNSVLQKRSIKEIWLNNLKEYWMEGPFLSMEWCFQLFSNNVEFCNVLQTLSLQTALPIILQRSSGAYPIDEESWDEFQRQRITDAIQLVLTNILGRSSCIFNGSPWDFLSDHFRRQRITNKVHEVASNSYLYIDNERFKDLCSDSLLWNDFHIGISDVLQINSSGFSSWYKLSVNARRNWILEQLKNLEAQYSVAYLSGIFFGLGLRGLLNTEKLNLQVKFPLILDSSDIFNLLANDGQTIRTCSILLGSAVAALRTQDRTLTRLSLMHIPSILPTPYTKSLQISNINQYAALLSLGLLHAQSNNSKIIQILYCELFRSMSELDDQSSIQHTVYATSAAISLGLVAQIGNQPLGHGNTSSTVLGITKKLIQAITNCGEYTKCLNNFDTGLKSKYIEYLPYNLQSETPMEFLNIEMPPILKDETNSAVNFCFNDLQQIPCSSKSYFKENVDFTCVNIPAILSLAVMHIKSANQMISSELPIPYDKPDYLTNFRPEILIFLMMAKIVIEWDTSDNPDFEYIRKFIPRYLWFLPPDKMYPCPIFHKNREYNRDIVNPSLINCVSRGSLDWIHCIQCRSAMLAGVIWGLGIVYSGTRNQYIKSSMKLILGYLENIPMLQIPLNIASTIRDEYTCSLHVTIDRWSRDLCIRTSLTSLSLCFSGSGDSYVYSQIEFFRTELLQSAQLLWTSSTAISAHSIYTIPSMEHVYSQLTAYNNALGFLYLSAGHLSFKNSDALNSSFLLLASYPIYARDPSDISTPGTIFQPLRFLYAIAAQDGNCAIIPKCFEESSELLDLPLYCSSNFKNKQLQHFIPIQVEASKMNSKSYWILPDILPSIDTIKKVTILGTNYYSLEIDFEKIECNNKFIHLLKNGVLPVQLRPGSQPYTWYDANYIILQTKNYEIPSTLWYSRGVSAPGKLDIEIFTNKHLEKFAKNIRLDGYIFKLKKVDSRLNYLESANEDGNLNYKHILPINETFTMDSVLDMYINNLLENLKFQLSECGIKSSLFSPHTVKLLRIILLLEKRVKYVLLVSLYISEFFKSQAKTLVRCIRHYYNLVNSVIAPSYEERNIFRLFLLFHSLPVPSYFMNIANIILCNLETADSPQDSSKEEFDFLIPSLMLSFPTTSSLGIQILRTIIVDMYYTRSRIQTGVSTARKFHTKSELYALLSA